MMLRYLPRIDLGCLLSTHACRMQRCAQHLHICKTTGTTDIDTRLLGFSPAARGWQHTQLAVQGLTMYQVTGMMD